MELDGAFSGGRRKIRLLDAGMINKIAAGEVVERPLSVIKELAENAIDAGASAITIEIKDGGITQLRVTDNGCGIPKDQLRTAFMQHATSKLADPEDLMRVMTLGFRGEALASIAAVARVEMITKTSDEPRGARIEIHGSNIIGEEEIGCAEGTTVIARDLFYNIPVRLKFLKKPAAEAGAISDMVDKLALGHPNIAFKYISGGSTVLQTNGNGDLKTAVYYVYGKEIARGLLPVDAFEGPYSVSGFLVKPALARGSRNYQTIFINGRYVKSDLLQSAVEEAYRTMLMQGKFPSFVLHVTMAPDLVDVNVHPNKLEVRFREEENLYRWMREAAAAALDDQNLIPQTPIERKSPPRIYVRETHEQTSFQQASPVPEKQAKPAPVPPKQTQPVPVPQKQAPQVLPVPEKQAQPAAFKQYKIIGQIFQTYWLIEQGDSLYVIDQHAAHERVLYETLLQSLAQRDAVSQRLLQPTEVRLSMRERQVLEDHIDLIEGFGFELEHSGPRVMLLAVPLLLKNPVSTDFFLEIVDRLEKINTSVSNPYELKQNAVATVACKAAVKANDSLSHAEAKALIERMMALENPFTCPHGRPTVIEMMKYDFEKKFKRV